jgi:hypothetical protein
MIGTVFLQARWGRAEQLFEIKNEDAIKQSQNLRDTCPCQVLSINPMYGLIQSHKTVPLSIMEVDRS